MMPSPDQGSRADIARLCLDLGVRRATAGLRRVPTVYVLGATKAGTTTLSSALWSHPRHLRPFAKELWILHSLPGFTAAWQFHPLVARLWAGYHHGQAHFSAGGYRKFFPLSGRRGFTSDCDPFNLYCPVAMTRIQHISPRARFIISLRDPVERAFSDYNMHRNRDPRHTPPTFEAAIDAELTAGEDLPFRKRFLAQGIYEPHLRRWFGAFPREQFMILQTRDLRDRPAEVARNLLAFIGQPHAELDMRPRNAGRYHSDLLSPTARARLSAYFRPHNARLGALLGCDLGWSP